MESPGTRTDSSEGGSRLETDAFSSGFSPSQQPNPTPVKRSAGRPKGSKNKSTLAKLGQLAESTPALDEARVQKRGPGRPKGSKNKKHTESQPEDSDASSILATMTPNGLTPGSVIPNPQLGVGGDSFAPNGFVVAPPVKRGPGRPKGSGKKQQQQKQAQAAFPPSPTASTPSVSFSLPPAGPGHGLVGRGTHQSESEAETPVPNSETNDVDGTGMGGILGSHASSINTTTPTAAPVQKRKPGRPRKNPIVEPKMPTTTDSLAALPQHELYFYNSKPGASKTSSHTFPLQRVVGYDAANEWINSLYPAAPSAAQIPSNGHHQSVQTLHSLQSSMFGQWIAEFEAGFNICAYGYGSKLYIARQFAKSIRLAIPGSSHPILMIDGFSPDFSLKDVLTAICGFLVPEDLKLSTNLIALRDTIIQGLSPHSPWKDRKVPPDMIILIINSIDSAPMRTARTQSILADLASLSQIAILATADTPNFQLMWDADTRERFHMVFHDCTTFASFHAEADMVQTLEYVLGGKNRRTGGIGGVEFVLKSLPANARSLFALLINEQLEVMRSMGGSLSESKRKSGRGDDDDDNDDDDDDDPNVAKDDEFKLGVEYHVLYAKMSEELICTSIHQFHTLLKEFVDHQLIELSRDPTGATRLRAPFRRSELMTLLSQMDEA